MGEGEHGRVGQDCSCKKGEQVQKAGARGVFVIIEEASEAGELRVRAGCGR